MGSPKELAAELKRTPRGRLSYDRDCFPEQSSLEEILEEVEAQHRRSKVSLIAELTAEHTTLSTGDSFTLADSKQSQDTLPISPFTPPPPPAGLPTSPKRLTPITKTARRSLLSPSSSPNLHAPRSLNRSFENSFPSEYSFVRDAKRRSLERRIILDNFIRDEVREAEVLFGKKCRIMSESNAEVSLEREEEEKENRIRDKIQADIKHKEEECKRRLSSLQEALVASSSSVEEERPPPSILPEKPSEPSLKLPPPVQKSSPPPPTLPLQVAHQRKTTTEEDKKVLQAPKAPILYSEAPPPPSIPKPQESLEASQSNSQLGSDVERHYSQLKSNLTALNDKSLKFALQKAVTTIINAICQASKAHLKEKLEKLTALSSGTPLILGDSKSVNSGSHPLGTAYVKYIMAEKFISHWDEGPKSIFALGAIMAALSSQFPDFGSLLLAVFYRTCPYILPRTCVQSQGETFKAYRIRCGYSYDEEDDKEEDKENFIKHMSGVIRLYAAYAIAELPQSHSNRSIFHGIGNLWRLSASTLNLSPVNEITAIVLCEVVEIGGNALLESYKNQFKALLDIMHRLYIQRIKAVTQEGCHGSLSRLEDLFDKFKKNQSIPRAEGALQSGAL